MNILEKKKKISKNQQKINSIKKNGKSANEHLTQTTTDLGVIVALSALCLIESFCQFLKCFPMLL